MMEVLPWDLVKHEIAATGGKMRMNPTPVVIGEDDRFPAPCEEDDLFEDDDERDSWMDDEPDDIDSDEGFDPYEGCFTFDC